MVDESPCGVDAQLAGDFPITSKAFNSKTIVKSSIAKRSPFLVSSVVFPRKLDSHLC
jgi:hypothetical protein